MDFRAGSSPVARTRKSTLRGAFSTKFAFWASEVAFGSEVHWVSEVSPYGEVGKLNFTLYEVQNFTMLLAFYLLSALPTLFFVIRIRSNAMRTIVYVVLFFVLFLSLVSFLYCRRLLPMMTFFATAVELMYLAIFDNSSGKDKLLTKIYVLAVHTWNRVYYNGSWWNMDVTNDITSTANGKKLYGFRELEDVSAPDTDFFITKIY